MNIIVGKRISELMKETGLNQVQLSKKIGIKQNTISSWVLNKKEPCINSLWLIADFFDVSIDYLVGREQPEE